MKHVYTWFIVFREQLLVNGAPVRYLYRVIQYQRIELRQVQEVVTLQNGVVLDQESLQSLHVEQQFRQLTETQNGEITRLTWCSAHNHYSEAQTLPAAFQAVENNSYLSQNQFAASLFRRIINFKHSCPSEEHAVGIS